MWVTDGAMGRTRHLADILTAPRRWEVEPSTPALGWQQGETRRRTRGRRQSGAGLGISLGLTETTVGLTYGAQCRTLDSKHLEEGDWVLLRTVWYILEIAYALQSYSSESGSLVQR